MNTFFDLRLDSNNQSVVNQSLQMSYNDSTCKILPYSPYLVPALFFMTFPIALFLNTKAALVSLHLKSTSTFVVYLKNLIAADIFLTIMIPVKIAGDLPGNWETLSIPTCRYFSVIFYNTQYTCIALLGFISLDRFFKIMMPRTTFAQNLTVSKVIAGSVWVIMFGVTGLPNMILTNKTVPSAKIISCVMLKSPAGIRFHEKTTLFLNVFFWIVSVTIAVCYICIVNKVIQSYRNSGSNNSQGKQKVKLRVFLVIIVFFVSFGPYHIVRIPYTFQQVSSSSTTTCSQIDVQIKLAKELTHWLSTTNICMDPLLYVFLCQEFKEQLMALLKKSLARFSKAVNQCHAIGPFST